MKRLNIILLLIFVFVLAVSKGRALSITDRSIVHAIGIDKAPGGCSVTLQIFKPEAAGADTPIDISKANFKTVTAEGKNIRECLSRLSSQTGSELFLGHLQLLVMAEDISFENAEDIFLPLRNDKSIYPGLYLACAENAREIVSFPIKENAVTAENYRGILENAAGRGEAFLARLIDIDNCLGESGTLALPYLEIKGDRQQKRLCVTKSKVLTQSGFDKDFISTRECGILSLISDEYLSLSTVLDIDIGGTLLAITGRRSDIDFSYEGGKVKCSIKVYAKTDGTEDITGLSEQAESELTGLLEKYLKDKRQDIAKLFMQLRFDEPFIYSKYQSRLYELYSMAEFDADIVLYS